MLPSGQIAIAAGQIPDKFNKIAILARMAIEVIRLEMHAIYKHDFSAEPHLDRQRDIFIFQCYIGCRVGDLLRLTREDIINNTLEYIPTKTIEESQKTIVVPLNKTAKEILEKYKDYEGKTLLPFISSQKYNDAIKVIFEKAGITRNVTWLNPLTGKEETKPCIQPLS